MDATTEYLSDYACRLTYDDLSPEAVHQVKRTLIDTLGCGVGAFDGEPASIARRVASRGQGDPPARILGTSQRTSMDLAAFANTVLVRYLDCNDTYAAERRRHKGPSRESSRSFPPGLPPPETERTTTREGPAVPFRPP